MQNNNNNITSWKSAIAGGASGIVSRMAIAPLDVIKINLQLNSNIATTQNKTTLGMQMIRMLAHIYKTEGIVGLYRGNTFAVALWSSYSAIQFPVFEYIKHTLQHVNHHNTLTIGHEHSISGAIAAAVATAATFPLDTFRTRYVYLGAREKTRAVFVNPYRGMLPALIVIMPTMALTFAWHEQLEHLVGLHSGIAGAIAGAAARMVVFPADTVKRRMMMESLVGSPSMQQQRRQPVLTIVRNMYIHEGLISFFKGALPSILKSAISTGVTFYVYDLVQYWLKDM
jgi:solute carrier family 25 thiamine pyrophosphate transporter 19